MKSAGASEERQPQTRRHPSKAKPKQPSPVEEAEPVPPEQPTPAEALKITWYSLEYLAGSLWSWGKFFLAYFRFDFLVLLALFFLLPWVARRLVMLALRRLLLPFVFGEGYDVSGGKAGHMARRWMSRVVDRVLPAGDNEGAAAAEGGKGSSGSMVGTKMLRWIVRSVLGV